MAKNRPKLIVIAGPNGSGKTSVTSQILKHEWVEGCIYINPDNIAQETPQYFTYFSDISRQLQTRHS